MAVESSAGDVRVILAGVWTLDSRIPSSGELAALLPEGVRRIAHAIQHACLLFLTG